MSTTFADTKTVRAAIYDILDARNIMDLWEGDVNGYGVSEEQANVSRTRFVDAVVDRISDLQSAPFDGVNLKTLCARHVMINVAPDPKARCIQCAAEQKAKGQSA